MCEEYIAAILSMWVFFSVLGSLWICILCMMLIVLLDFVPSSSRGPLTFCQAVTINKKFVLNDLVKPD